MAFIMGIIILIVMVITILSIEVQLRKINNTNETIVKLLKEYIDKK